MFFGDPMKSSFLLYLDQHKPIKNLTYEQKGILFDAFFIYQGYGVQPVFEDPVIEMAFGFFKQTFDRDSDKYLKRCEKNRDNINKRWNKKDTNVYKRIQSDTKHTESDSDSDTDNESYNDIKKKKKKKKIVRNPYPESFKPRYPEEAWTIQHGE